jgi:hypothetical protein
MFSTMSNDTEFVQIAKLSDDNRLKCRRDGKPVSFESGKLRTKPTASESRTFYSKTLFNLFAVLVLWATVCGQTADGLALAPNKSKRGSTRRSVDSDNHRLQVTCGFRICDLRTHYCDAVINNCARCDDDCHPARINGDPDAIAECQRNCKCKKFESLFKCCLFMCVCD